MEHTALRDPPSSIDASSLGPAAGAAAAAADMPRALVFMTGRDCEMYVGAAISSAARQTHGCTRVLFVDDASDDDTGTIARELLSELFPGRHHYVRNDERWGKARSAHVHLRAHLADVDFVAVLDADDELIRPDALALIGDRYAAGDDVVWTNFVTDTGMQGGNGPLDPTRSPRGQGWRTSHLFTFRASLFAQVPEDCFRNSRGEWLRAACDFAIAYPILDQTRRYRYLPILAHRYRSTNPYSHHKSEPGSVGLNSPSQQACAAEVLAKPPLPCVRAPLSAGALTVGEAGAPQIAAACPQPRVRTGRPDGSPSRDATSRAGIEPWLDAAAAALARECPGLLDLMLDSGTEDGMDVASAWRWWRWLRAGPERPKVLEIGAGATAGVLHAMVSALGGEAVTVSDSEPMARGLFARLWSVGIRTAVYHVPTAQASFEGIDGSFPDIGALGAEHGPFDAVIVSAASLVAGPRSALLALPMVAPRLDPSAFRVCLWAPDHPDLHRAAEQCWSRVAPELSFSAGALGGTALCVHGPE